MERGLSSPRFPYGTARAGKPALLHPTHTGLDHAMCPVTAAAAQAAGAALTRGDGLTDRLDLSEDVSLTRAAPDGKAERTFRLK